MYLPRINGLIDRKWMKNEGRNDIILTSQEGKGPSEWRLVRSEGRAQAIMDGGGRWSAFPGSLEGGFDLSKFFIFAFLWWLTGNPFVALIVILFILYLVDRRFVGLLPSMLRPFRLNGRLARIRQELALNPFDTSNKLEAARILIEKKRYAAALPYLQEIYPVMDESAEVLYELGWCLLKTGDQEKGEELVLQALEINPRVKYGEPYLRLGEAFARNQPEKALGYLEQFKTVQSSSCEAYYRLGQIYKQLGKDTQANQAFREATEIYKSLPRYKRKAERRWAILAVLSRK